eukprot:TRINITY_DN2526_c0_g2_i5.p6 TRINITY_DN2526_c0_g2~~TRINITY_DN2526_c0_g2_i5.p6  ORF type:complete len:104 (-),score=19.89 TRINITY_DN2526_c0_g2_i5:313-624(-)
MLASTTACSESPVRRTLSDVHLYSIAGANLSRLLADLPGYVTGEQSCAAEFLQFVFGQLEAVPGALTVWTGVERWTTTVVADTTSTTMQDEPFKVIPLPLAGQ